MISFHDSLCRRVFFDLFDLCPVAPSLLSCPLLLPFVPLACGEFAMSCAGDMPFAASREYWFRPSRPRDFWGGRPPRRGIGVGFKGSICASGGADTEFIAGAGGSSVGVGVASRASDSAGLSVKCISVALSLTYRLLSYVQRVLCVCLLRLYVPAHAPSRVVPFRAGFLPLPLVAFASAQRLLCCRPRTQLQESYWGILSLFVDA